MSHSIPVRSRPVAATSRPAAARSRGLAGMSRVAAVTLAGATVLAVAGGLSGRLLGATGALGALEWVLRTLVVVAAAVVVVGGLVLVARVRRRVRPRPLGWAAAFVASTAFLWLAAIPIVYGVYLTHLPGRRAVHDTDLGAPKEPVALKGADGVTLRGWYVPSRNGAAVLALHGTGSNRLGVASHARLLARHGYGVLALDLRGHGESGGRSTSAPWKLDDDLDAALDWLRARPDVHRGRIGAVGVSLGGEVALQLAARRPDLRAVVGEGIVGGTAADARAAHQNVAAVAQLGALEAVSSVLAGGGSPAPDGELVARVAPRPLLLISSGRSSEAAAGRAFARRGGASTALWNLPRAAHGAALRTDPAGYERRVVGFLDRALRQRSTSVSSARSAATPARASALRSATTSR